MSCAANDGTPAAEMTTVKSDGNRLDGTTSPLQPWQPGEQNPASRYAAAAAAAAATRKSGCITLSTLTLMCSSSYLSTCGESFCKIAELFNGKMGDGGVAGAWWEEWEVN